MIKLHKEGKNFIIFFALILVGINIAIIILFSHLLLLQYMVGVSSLAILVLVLRFFRNPGRFIEVNPVNVVSPADGKVVVIEETREEEYLKKKCIQVSIFMSVHNVHINRYPVSGKVVYYKYHPGKYFIARHPKTSTMNERNTIVMETDNKQLLLIRQIAGYMARRICCYAKEGKYYQQGEELGFIKFGSRVDIFLPLDTKLNIKIGDKVIGNKSIIAFLD
ncbi:MAG: phosphatidylserine decarboxylase family protein [Bacteroidota bacterium]